MIGDTLDPDLKTLVILRALGAQKSRLAPLLAEAELAVTYPGEESISARRTLQVVRQMIESAQKEVLVAGFAITKAGGLFDLLVAASRRGVRILLLCSDWVDADQRTGAELAKCLWPLDAPRPEVHEFRGEGVGAMMHIKCLLVDGAEILLGSANFTRSGMIANFEMGIWTRGPVAVDARRVFDSFLSGGGFTEVSWD